MRITLELTSKKLVEVEAGNEAEAIEKGWRLANMMRGEEVLSVEVKND